MSVRTWQATPSAQVELEGKVWPVITQNDLAKALMDGAIALDRLGGCLQVVLQRQPTGVPNEMLTVAALVVWMDRTNAKAQPESVGLELVNGEPGLEQELEEALEDDPDHRRHLDAVLAEPDNGRNLSDEQVAAAVAAATEAPDGEQPDVDESDVPEALRSG